MSIYYFSVFGIQSIFTIRCNSVTKHNFAVSPTILVAETVVGGYQVNTNQSHTNKKIILVTFGQNMERKRNLIAFNK